MTNYKKWLWSSQKDKAALSTSKGLEYCPNTTYLNLTRIASLSTCAEPDARTLKDEQGALGTWTWSLSMTGSLLERKLLRRCSQCQLQVKTCEKEKIAKKNKTCNYQCYEDQIGWYFGEVIDYIIYECDFHLHHCRIKSYLSHYCASFIEGLKITNVTICSLKLGQFQLHPDFPRDNSPTPRRYQRSLICRGRHCQGHVRQSSTTCLRHRKYRRGAIASKDTSGSTKSCS